ncbi:MAG: MFS transporter [Minisyncoccia bacterium]
MNFYLEHYLKHSLRREISELYISVAIKNFAFSMITIFEPVFIYKQFNSVSIVFLYYAVIYTIYIFAIPLGSKAAAKFGFEHCIFYSIPFAIFYFLALSQIPNNSWMVLGAIISVIMYKILFWPAYHTDFAHYSKSGYRGRELGTLSFVSTISTIIGPIIGGIILSKFGFEVLFVIVSIVSLISAIPLFSTREKFLPHNFSYRRAFRRLITPYDHYKRKNSIAYFGYGEEIIVAIGWPIFIYLIIEKFYLMGLLIGVVTIAMSVVSLYVGKLSDTLNMEGKKHLMNFSAVLRCILSFFRSFSGNWLGILLIDIFSTGSKIGIDYPLVTSVYNKGDGHKGFLKYVTFFEMSLSIGKAAAAWIVFVFSLVLSGFSFWFFIFGLSGVWSLLYMFKFKKS